MAMIKCTNCGLEVSEFSEKCPNCGAIIEKSVNGIESDINSAMNGADSQLNKTKKGKGKKIGIILGVAGFIIIAAVVFFIIKSNTLTGYDKKAYEMILEASKSFKNPSSVRLVSGGFMWQTDYGTDNECTWLFCKLSATNGLGNRTSDDYDVYISDDDGKVHVSSTTFGSASAYQSRDKLDIKKINKKLEAELGDY